MQKEKKETIEFEQVVSRGCGIDVHKEVIVLTIRGEGLREETFTYSTFTEELEKMRDMLKEKQITHIAM